MKGKQRAACRRKKQFGSAVEALSVNPQHQPYLCQMCGYFHLAGTRSKQRRVRQ